MANIELGSQIPELDTEHIGFKALSQGGGGAKKVKILPTSWPTDKVPPACASLLSIASKIGLLAAAGPDVLVVASTEKARKAFQEQAGQGDVVSSFIPDVTLPVPQLRHVAFSADGDFLVISAENEGGLAVLDSAAVIKGKTNPEVLIDTDKVAVRALLPNPTSELAHFFAVVYESGKLVIANVADGTSKIIRNDGVSCVAWSTKGKAVVAALQDGTLAVHMAGGEHKGAIPRPPNVGDNFTAIGLSWLNNEEFFVAHSPNNPDAEANPDNIFNYIKTTKGWTSSTFHACPYDPCPTTVDAPERKFPPRVSTIRLRNWQPALDDMLIMTTSRTETISVFATTSDKISPAQETLNVFTQFLIDDNRKAQAPRTVYGEDMDSVFVGEALDLSATEKLLAPVPSLAEEGISEAPWPLPAYMALTHEGLLAAWWVLWDKSIKEGQRYPGLVVGSEESQASISSPKPVTTASQPSSSTNSVLGRPTATFGSPATPGFGNTGFGSSPAALMKPTPPGFGIPGFGSTTSAFAKPAKPAFGSASTVGAAGGSGFGAAGGLGNKASPWGVSSQPAQPEANSFSTTAAGGSSGFAKFGQPGGGFSSFGNKSAESGFAAFGQQKPSFGQSQSGSGFGQLQQSSGFGALKAEPSFGSTVTVASGAGSTLPSWANTPAQNSGIFGASKSSFNTSSFESRASDMSEGYDAQRRQRDETTPTPHIPPQQSNNLFGLASGFKLGTTFKSDGTAKDDPAKPAASDGLVFSSDFESTLGAASLKPPATPSKNVSQEASTTPATAPRQKPLFPSDIPVKESATPTTPPLTKKAEVDDAPLPPDFVIAETSKVDDAPLPPDFVTTKPSKAADDELPPLAGSPGVKVEAPSSEVEISPLDDDDDDDDEDEEFSDEEEEESQADEEEENEEEEDVLELSPVKGGFSNSQSKAGVWNFQDSVNQSPGVKPPAPTPPASKFMPQPGKGAPLAQPALLSHSTRPSGSRLWQESSPLFGSTPQKGPFSISEHDQSTMPSAPIFPPPTNRAQDTLRSPSPARSGSVSSLRTKRDPLVPAGSSLSSSVLQPRTPTPQPQVADLEDEDDERVREQLAQPIKPSRDLEEFVAHQNYSGTSAGKTGHAAQIEMLYKDINSMVDALGWNARSLQSFVMYHEQSQGGHKVDRDALEEVGDDQGGHWFERFNLCEIAALKALESDLERELDAGRVQDFLDKLSQLSRLLQDNAKLMTRLNDVRRQIINRKDPEKTQAHRNAPLPKELADGQRALRNDYAQLLVSLQKAEDAASILRSRLAAHNASNNKPSAVPTMDAVRRTIIKLTKLAERHNNDITLLESQLRKIELADGPRASSSLSCRQARTPRRAGRTSLRNSIAETPFVTPPTNRSMISLGELNRRALTPDVGTSTPSKGYGLEYSPDGTDEDNQLSRLSEAVDENMSELRESSRKRGEVVEALRKALGERGVRMVVVR